MVIDLPADAPRTTADTFAFIGTMKDGTTVDGLKILALGEALSKDLYYDMADQVDDPAVKALLRANGDEEMKHARRVAEAIEILSGTPFHVPDLADNPCYSPVPSAPVSRDALAKLAEGEMAGLALYEGIAACFDNEEAKALLLANGHEELDHGRRLHEAMSLLPA